MEAPTPVGGGAIAARRTWPTTAVVVALSALAVVSAVGRSALLGPVRDLPEMAAPVLPTDVVGPLVAVGLAGLGALVVLRGEARRYGWLLLAMGTSTGVHGFATEYSVYAAFAGSATLPFTAAAGWVQDLWMVPWFLGFLLLPALFPDGTPASDRWGRRVRVTAAVWVGLIVVFMLTERPLTNAFLEIAVDPPANPTGFLPVPEMALNLTWLAVTLASIVIGIASLVARWRHADVEGRQQLKWVLYAFGVLLVLVAADLVNQALEAGVGLDLGLAWPLAALFATATVGLVAALGFAVLKRRLYEVDLVINRTIVYAVLTVVIVVAYVMVVVGVGALLPVEETFLSLVATGIVAIGFSPLRTRLQRWVNRFMFGQRDDPYAVLSELGRLLARSGAPEATLQTVAETVATAMKLPGAAVELEQDGTWQTPATYGKVPYADVDAVVVAMRYQGEVVGRLVVAPRSPHEPLSPADHRLLADIAHQTGALAHAVRLTMALQRSRERLVLAREEERRRIRRDLHDGLGPSLASQTFRLDVVLTRLHDDPATAADLVTALKHQNQDLVADIRRLVYELRPPALDQLGLAGALTAHAGQLDRHGQLTVNVETAPDPLPALPAAVEVAAYRIGHEALTNVARHADATRCTATLKATDTALSIEVCDDGTGLEPSSRPGVGLTSMRERTAELSGTLEISARQPTGTRIHATLPIATPTTRNHDEASTLRGKVDARHG